ncbi:MAG: beta-ketoacyl-ACP synthase II [Clostridia bacterium]|nr:beta-ketoacyl-ACP synthase II [Clostridia bacterium]
MRRVVVTGLGAVSPVGLDVASTWNSLISGRHGIAKITRFDTEGFKATLAAEVKDFDPTLYMDKSEVRRSDLFTQFALAAAVQAVNDSGIEGTIAPERLGVYSGSGVGGLITISNEIEKLITKGPKKVSPLFIPMMIANIATGTIAIRFNAKGPSLPVVTACATSTNAVGEAYRAILHGYADAIIAGGSEATITPIGIAGFTNCMALTTSDDPDCASIPFDKRRNGFLMGEGAGMLILEEYERAKARGAKIYAELVGYSSTNDAYHITAPAPDGESAALAIAQTFEQAKGERAQCIYINAHGTSTPMNDKTETAAIKKALGEERARKAVITSTKSMTGHMLGATGALEALVAVLALKEGVAPPTVGLKEPDPECDLDYAPGVKRVAPFDLALSNSLGFGGHNACLAFVRAED